jgi:hypothetical protein
MTLDTVEHLVYKGHDLGPTGSSILVSTKGHPYVPAAYPHMVEMCHQVTAMQNSAMTMLDLQFKPWRYLTWRRARKANQAAGAARDAAAARHEEAVAAYKEQTGHGSGD